jgi:hypothetical protein
MKKISYIAVAAVAALAFSGCNMVNGKELPSADGGLYYYPDGGPVSGQKCSFDGDCGKGRYCTDQKYCALDCITSNDCIFKEPDQSRPNTLACSACGRCLPKGEKDVKCSQSSKDYPCTNTGECQAAFSDKYVCSPRNYCTTTCTKDDQCTKNMGRGFYCTDGVCTKACTWDRACLYFGWGYKCDLPADIDQVANTYPAPGGQSVVSECIRNPDGIDWGKYVDKTKPSYKYVGIWAEQCNTTVRSTGTPLLPYMDTMSSQGLILKITQGPNGTLEFNHKYCYFNLMNFFGKDEEYTNAKMITPDRYADYCPVDVNKSLAPAPDMAADAVFPTDTFWELRGAKLANLFDPLPDFKNCPQGNCSTQYDQDKDGHPGMTTLMTGIITAEIYNTQRWSQMMSINVVDQDHLRGLITHSSEQTVIDASNSSALQTLTYVMHPDLDRSYFRALRVSDDASCDDVAKLIQEKGGYLERTWHCPECK